MHRSAGAACHNPATHARPRRTPPEGPAIDIIFLVERLESLIANGKSLPLTKNVIIDRDAALNLIDELRVAVPEEVRAAKRINSEGERIIDKAEEEAERIIARAQEQAAILIDERGLTDAAAEEGRRIIDAAGEDASEIRRGADDYAAGVLRGLEADVMRTLRSIERGLELLNERRAALVPGADAEPATLPGDQVDPEDAYDMYDEEGVDDVDAGPAGGAATRARS